MRVLIGLLTLFLSAAVAHADHPAAKDKRKAVLLDGLGSIHHPVLTKNVEAQKFFDQGLRLIYAFNHDEAFLAFERAAELDPGLGMAYWGMALSVGPNYNLDAEAEQLKMAYESIQKARKLAANAPRHEQDYIEALATRYSADPRADRKKLAGVYKNAMGALAKRYPDDLDAATLYAESMMNLRPWELWSHDGKPAEGTEEIIAVLESVLRRNPEHTGANHYYIHAVEASPTPERGLAAAHALSSLAPAAGHLVHMPAHIFMRVGDYDAAARANEKAAAVDRAYIEKFKIMGVYPMMYYSHNLHFLAVAHAMQGRHADAQKAADRLTAHVGSHIKDMPMLEFFLPTSMLVQVRCQRWGDILALPPPDAKLTIVKSLWHFARGTAFARQGKRKEIEQELAELRSLHKNLPDELAYGDRNKAKKVLLVPLALLEARLALADKDHKTAVAALERASAAEDALNYIEPADWYLPVREVLGAVHYAAGDFVKAEKTFRDDLERNRRNPRALFGLMESLKAQGKTYAAGLVEQEFAAAWRRADLPMPRLEDY